MCGLTLFFSFFRQASECICLFRDVAKRFPAKGREQVCATELTDWGRSLLELEQVFGLRQCAKATRKNYRHWILQFQEFLNSKPVNEVNDDERQQIRAYHLQQQQHHPAPR